MFLHSTAGDVSQSFAEVVKQRWIKSQQLLPYHHQFHSLCFSNELSERKNK